MSNDAIPESAGQWWKGGGGGAPEWLPPGKGLYGPIGWWELLVLLD